MSVSNSYFFEYCITQKLSDRQDSPEAFKIQKTHFVCADYWFFGNDVFNGLKQVEKNWRKVNLIFDKDHSDLWVDSINQKFPIAYFNSLNHYVDRRFVFRNFKVTFEVHQ